MAIIAGQVPPAQELPVDFKRRVVIKFRPGTQLPYSDPELRVVLRHRVSRRRRA